MSDAHLTQLTIESLSIPEPLKRGIAELGYARCTPIQAQTLPVALGGRDVAGQAQTGTGKTAAFVLPALHRISHQETKKTRVLILTPTRELANQITKSFSVYGKFLKFKEIESLLKNVHFEHIDKFIKNEKLEIVLNTEDEILDAVIEGELKINGKGMLTSDENDLYQKFSESFRNSVLFTMNRNKNIKIKIGLSYLKSNHSLFIDE